MPYAAPLCASVRTGRRSSYRLPPTAHSFIRGRTMTQSTHALAQDFDNVVSDAQELLKTIGNEGDARLVEAKKRMQASLAIAKNRLLELQTTVTDGARAAATTTDE